MKTLQNTLQQDVVSELQWDPMLDSSRIGVSVDDGVVALLQGAVAELRVAGVGHDVLTVPGALEIPAAIAIAFDAAEKNGKPYDAAIALGCVVRGETFHFEIVAMESSRGLMDISINRRIPLGNGILTVNTEEQAWGRAKSDDLNKGGDAARAA